MILGGPVTIALVASELALRRRRARHISQAIFGEPAWDFLLDLYLAQAAKSQLSLSDIAVGAGLGHSTTTRWVMQLEDRGLVKRTLDHTDARRTVVQLTALGQAAIEAIFASDTGDN